jgi:hypothetical protein
MASLFHVLCPALRLNPKPSQAASNGHETQKSSWPIGRRTVDTFCSSPFHGTLVSGEGTVTFRAWFQVTLAPCLRRKLPSKSKENGQNLMSRRMIWAENEDFTGWCCSYCQWGVIAPRLESTVAALTFNRIAQENFEKHTCSQSTHDTTRNFRKVETRTPAEPGSMRRLKCGTPPSTA